MSDQNPLVDAPLNLVLNPTDIEDTSGSCILNLNILPDQHLTSKFLDMAWGCYQENLKLVVGRHANTGSVDAALVFIELVDMVSLFKA